MTDSAVAVRRATAADADRLLAWANDPVIRSAGFQTEPISAEEHAAWFGHVLADPTERRTWIGHDGSGDIGVFRVALTPDGALEIGIALAAGARGTRRARPLLDAGLVAAREAFPGRRFRAWVRATNAPSLALFRAAGFEPSASRPTGPPGAPPDAIVLERD
jgi:RimJ/RimL family protein N-acetyltransferase